MATNLLSLCDFFFVLGFVDTLVFCFYHNFDGSCTKTCSIAVSGLLNINRSTSRAVTSGERKTSNAYVRAHIKKSQRKFVAVFDDCVLIISARKIHITGIQFMSYFFSSAVSSLSLHFIWPSTACILIEQTLNKISTRFCVGCSRFREIRPSIQLRVRLIKEHRIKWNIMNMNCLSKTM